LGQITSAGYVVTTEAEYIEKARSAFEDALGVSVDWDAAVVLNELVSLHASAIADLDMAIKALDDNRRPGNAAGLQLADIGAMRGITPDPGGYSTGTVTLGAWSGGSVVVPAGYEILANGDGLATRGDRWETTADVTISASSTATVAIRSSLRGTYPLNTSDTFRQAGSSFISGVSSLVSASTATAGSAPDTAADFRKTLASRVQFGSRSADALATAIRAIPGVEACLAFDNPSLTATSVSGIAMPPGSMCVVVHPDTIDAEAQKQVAGVIYGMAPTGIKIVHPTTSGSTGAKFGAVGGDGIQKVVGWYWSVANPVNVTVTITAFDDGFVLADVSDAVEEAITEYFAGLTVGQTVRRLDILAAIAAVDGVAGASISSPASDTTSTAIQYPTVGTITVS
jgi:uncharacterized phage protein gp47/JayE